MMFDLDLTGRVAVVVGAGVVGARSITAFAGAGAQVRVISPTLHPDIDPAAVTWIDRDYAGPADLSGAWIVHTATGRPETDTAVAADAARQQTWCIDASLAGRGTARVPARTRVTTPDGPITVATTASDDPRRAVAARDRIAEALRTGEVDLRRRRPRLEGGWVALVGGGPGTPDLMTVRGHTLLASADVVVVDRLAPRELLARLPSEVEIIDVGKAPGRHSASQQEINQLLIHHASAGRGVVRLKGGDPYVFGRGGEERLACEQAGLPVEIVPGISSALAVPAVAGIPLTHRGVARGFTVVTGHDQLSDLPGGAGHTVVILMAVSGLRGTVRALLSSGREPSCPAAIVERGTMPGQRTTVATLADLADRAETVGVSSPAVIVVGDVVRLSPAWARQPQVRTPLSATSPSAAT